MASLNKVQLMGNTANKPEIRAFPNSGDRIATVRLATNEHYRDRNGQQQTVTEWHNVVFVGRVVDTVERLMDKGASIYVEGRLRTRKWQDKDGHDRYTTEIVAPTFQFLGSKKDGGSAGDTDGDGVPPGYMEDDVPM